MPDLEELIRACMKSGGLREREVRDKDGVWHLLRIRPYRTAEHRIEGAVVGLINIHSLKTTVDRLSDANDFLQMIIQSVLNPLIVLDADRRVIQANDALYRTFRTSKEETINRSFYC